jgi:alpha-D-ribose 1-methylphosphonate 5-triphosphate diphosphatase PhnM
LPVTNVESISLEDFSLTSHDVAVRLGLHGRGGIKLGATADLLLLRLRRTANSRPVIHWSDLHQVMVAGTVVFDTEEVIGWTSGTLLSNRLTKQFT